ncbi:trypsin-like peptidase domain-containing protein [Aeromonas hydrophila]|uniref:trypsin-like peptidase domain-containing protein n=1 Tax=Aeromonas hydrophila TaxID=644 RepID=UPI0009BBBB94|nr:serine protease [Aeromonas hydrophila]
MEVKTISESILFATVRIDTVDVAGNRGSGTGFIFSHNYKEQNFLSIVTNKHVVNGAVKGGITFIKREDEQPKLGHSFRIDFDEFEKLWDGHPNENIDVAVTPLVPLLDFMKQAHNVDVFFKFISSESIPSTTDIAEIDALEEVVFVGYPNGIWDSKNHTPIIRKGTTATPYALDFEGAPKFIIDASVFGGSSGSPLFLYNSGTYTRKDGGTVVGSRFFFLGVVAAVFFKSSVNEIISLPIPTHSKNVVVDQEMIDLGVVYKANTVVEAIEFAIEKSQQLVQKP